MINNVLVDELSLGRGAGPHPPGKILITGGHELGGVGSVAAGLAQGFQALGIPAEVILPSKILSRLRDLRDPEILKILSTTAVLAAPMSKRVICIAHGIPCADVQGWAKLAMIIGSFKVANACGAQLVAVSDYTAVHLQTIFNITVNRVIRNPLKPIFLAPRASTAQERCYITYLGRLHPAKNIHRLLPAICDLLNERPDLRACIIGDGELRVMLQESVRENPRVEFKGTPNDDSVCEWLRRTKVFVSGNCTEGLGVTYLEALSQGCVVAMPASGGGVELALGQLGSSVHLLPLSLDRSGVLDVLRRAASSDYSPMQFTAYAPESVAATYLDLDSGRSSLAPQTLPNRTKTVSLS